jgi:Tfp pilus assembly protein PilF
MFKKALDINPTSYESYLGLGWVYKDKENVIRRIKAKDKKPSKKMFEEALEIDPKNYQAYMGLGWVYKDEGKIDLSVEMFKKAIKIKPNDIDAYLSLGWMYYEMGEYISAEKIFIKARAIDPEDPEPYIGLGAIYQNFSRSGASKEKIKKAEGFFKKAVTQGNLSAYKYLGSVYLDRLNFILAEESYKKAVQNQPYDYEIYNGLGTIYLKQEKFQEAEDNFLKAIQLNINNEKGYLGLNSVYEKQGKSAMAETVLSQAARLSNDEFPYAKLAIVYHKKGQQGLSERYFKKANEMRMNYYVRGTKNNYNRLKDLLKKENIKFVVLGYPLREIDYVRKIVGENKNVTFVNNGPIFKEKITKTNVSKYFSDMFGGDTGVLTVQGMEVLAENIANQIKKIFY